MSNGHRYCCLAMLESTTKLKIHRTVFLVSRGIVICSKSHPPPRLLLSVRMHNSTVQRASQPFFFTLYMPSLCACFFAANRPLYCHLCRQAAKIYGIRPAACLQAGPAGHIGCAFLVACGGTSSPRNFEALPGKTRGARFFEFPSPPVGHGP